MLESRSVAKATVSLVSLALVEELNHRVVNEYAEAISSLSLAASSTGDPIAKAAIDRAASRLRDHAAAHRTLMPPAVPDDADLGAHVSRICEAFTRATLAQRRVRLVLTTAEVRLPADQCWRIGLILVELIRNAARHGLGGSEGQISVSIEERIGILVCEVRDNGRPSVRTVPGRGQGLIRGLVNELGGRVDWSFTVEGAVATMRIPVEAPTMLGDFSAKWSEVA
ncbi:hypothetical protein GON01_06595 [Sphingomonas sp. MAH-20]|uniref:histidine kinase n=1 Tax=Sphingomonas horti TaxID=2682842 RepID=A0A6I4IZA0_9SPHN|nr:MULTISPECIES: sensor histidine kinase [Sphingomonas]MBA2920666.1 sensor histidine kinase [Sphingomonas sp. CGMCC 1.13658]MVO77602.1 hypothetical protein [Sphingomonas horti]